MEKETLVHFHERFSPPKDLLSWFQSKSLKFILSLLILMYLRISIVSILAALIFEDLEIPIAVYCVVVGYIILEAYVLVSKYLLVRTVKYKSSSPLEPPSYYGVWVEGKPMKKKYD